MGESISLIAEIVALKTTKNDARKWLVRLNFVGIFLLGLALFLRNANFL